jgi:mannose-6-phosphate isomerase-like protein (cupin superfamily)
MIGYTGNIEDITAKNNNFRTVLYTGKYAQLVVMSLLAGEEIGSEVHQSVDQFFRLESGTLKVIMNGEETTLIDGMVVIVPAGTTHNLINIGTDVAKLYTIYSPPNHPVNTVHATKADAMAAEEAEHGPVKI